MVQSREPKRLLPEPIRRFLAYLTALVVALRRPQFLRDEQFSVPSRDRLAATRSESLELDSRANTALNVLLVASVLLAVGSVAYAVTVAPGGEQFTELYLLTEDDGEPVADGYPEEMVRGESEPVTVGISNQEYELTEYTVVVQLQRVETIDNETRVIERQRIDRLETTLAHNETWHREHELTPTMTGEDLRVQYLLYRGDPPDDPTDKNAYRSVHLWIDVEE